MLLTVTCTECQGVASLLLPTEDITVHGVGVLSAEEYAHWWAHFRELDHTEKTGHTAYAQTRTEEAT